MLSKLDRYKGALVGLHAGDALGAPYETWSADKVREDMARRGGLVPFDYQNPWSKKEPPAMCPKGRPTDDSDHAAALAESLIANKGLNQEDLFYRLRRVVFDHVSPLWSGKAFGAGSTTRNALRPATWEESRDRVFDPMKEFPSNGSLMRATPMALLFDFYDKSDWYDVIAMSAVTHRHPLAVEVTCVFVRILQVLVEGDLRGVSTLTDAALGVAWFHAIPELRTLITNCTRTPRDPEAWPGRGAAALTLHVALWALTTSDNFRDGLIKAIAVGGDTDTYAAVAGALLGARYGYEGIPAEWRECLLGHDKMVELAENLYRINHQEG
ncbi:MAG: ADP-ribosylglycohydrolase family protein [bacterium]|nr:ADP-ribosylglycohydrolase family protein [bacterium]